MNQFLAGLIERATLRVPVLERRPRSLFEPTEPALAPPPVAIDGAGQPEPGEPDDLDELDERLGPPHGDEAASPPRPEPAASERPKPRSTRIASPPDAAVPTPPGSPAAPAPSPARQGSGEPRLVSPTAARHGELERATEVELPPAPALPLPPPAGERGRLPMPARMSAQRSPTRPAASAMHEPPRARSIQPPHARSVQPPRARSIQPPRADALLTGPAPAPTDASPVPASVPLLQAEPRLPGPPALLVRSQAAPRAAPANGSEAPPPAPVHVTIGRIEVRASAPAADRAPVRRPPAAPRMTLESYLNGQRGGSR